MHRLYQNGVLVLYRTEGEEYVLEIMREGDTLSAVACTSGYDLVRELRQFSSKYLIGDDRLNESSIELLRAARFEVETVE